MNDPRDLDILHAAVCRDYSAFRAQGGRWPSPYHRLWWQYLGMQQTALIVGKPVSPVRVDRPDGSIGLIDLTEMFKEFGYVK
ncbi:hypothetical protein ACQR0Z_17395 [Bradyrhizobium sp. HKCCYLS3077]|uniref:hypothetical protein n=1 Tax=Bradyrhizobium sp. HKCCYLS3077 TaxID=3420761 RepID=UPI003EB6B2F8